MNAMKKPKTNIFVQYGMVGAALGLYYGIFYKPSGQQDIGITFVLGIFAAAVTVLVRSWRKGYEFKKILKDFVYSFIFFEFFLLTLALRYNAFELGERLISNEWGGTVLVIITSTLSGVALGLMMAWHRVGDKPKEDQSEK